MSRCINKAEMSTLHPLPRYLRYYHVQAKKYSQKADCIFSSQDLIRLIAYINEINACAVWVGASTNIATGLKPVMFSVHHFNT